MAIASRDSPKLLESESLQLYVAEGTKPEGVKPSQTTFIGLAFIYAICIILIIYTLA
jgi:hypothetical protein